MWTWKCKAKSNSCRYAKPNSITDIIILLNISRSVAVTQSEKEFRALLHFGWHTGKFKLEGTETWPDSRKMRVNWVLNILKIILWATVSTELFFYVEFITGIISEVSVLATVISNFLSLCTTLQNNSEQQFKNDGVMWMLNSIITPSPTLVAALSCWDCGCPPPPHRAWMSASCDCCVLSGWGFCEGPITRPEESWVCRVCVWSREFEQWGGLGPSGAVAPQKNI